MSFMNMKTKRSLSIILFLGLVILVSWSSPATAAKDITGYINVDAEGFFFIDFTSIVESGIFDEMMKSEEDKLDFDDIKKKTGIDLKKSVDSILMVITKLNSGSESKGEPEFYLLINGDLSLEEFFKIAAVKEESNVDNFKMKNIEGYEVYANENRKDGDDPVYIHFFENKELILANNTDSLVTGIKTIKGIKPTITSNPVLLSAYNKSNRKHDFWGVILNDKSALGDSSNNMFPALKKITSVYLGGSYDGRLIDLESRLFADNKETIKQIHSTLLGMKMMVQGMLSEENPEVAVILEKMKLEQDKEYVSIALTVEKKEIEALAKKADAEDEIEQKEMEAL